jgi:hypothetical protein
MSILLIKDTTKKLILFIKTGCPETYRQTGIEPIHKYSIKK